MHGLHYAGVPLDRAEPLRRDADWQRQGLADPASRVFPLWRSRNLIAAEEVPRAVALSPAAELVAAAEEIVFLGLNASGRACFAADVSHLDEADLGALTDGARFTELRRVGAILDYGQGSILAYARGMLHWHRRHRFYGACSAATESRNGGHIRVCIDPACGAHHFPRTDPAVIMLITRGMGDGGSACWPARPAGRRA